MSVRITRGKAIGTAMLLPWLTLVSWGQSPESTAPLGELFATVPGAPAAAQLAGTGMSVVSGSELTAGVAPATLKLARGGQVRICPQTNLTVSEAGTGLMLGMGTGAVEIEYRVGQGANDVLVTPDFSVRLVGPNAYHFAFGVSSRGDTCFKPLSGNAAGVLLTEVMGADSYGTSPNETMVFSGGKLAGRVAPKEECGCPSPSTVLPRVLQAEAPPAPDQRPGATTSPESAPTRDPTTPLPTAKPGEAPVVVTPFVFSGAAQPASVARLQLSSLPNTVFLQDEPEPVVLIEKPADVSAQDGRKPDAQTKQEKEKEQPKKENKENKGFMARLKGFFGSLFHR